MARVLLLGQSREGGALLLNKIIIGRNLEIVCLFVDTSQRRLHYQNQATDDKWTQLHNICFIVWRPKHSTDVNLGLNGWLLDSEIYTVFLPNNQGLML